ncbi:MAG: sigma-70 family RNA polymerase sigma factor [Burkholderiaceae bacterium]
MLSTSAPTLAATQAPAPHLAKMRPVPWADLTPHRSYLLNYARRRLQDPALAEDLVHDVFEAVVTGRAHFAGLAALRSWLVGILKHKIIDLVRQRRGHDSLDADHDDDNTGIDFGHPTLVCPQPRPDEVAEQRQRLAQTMRRIAALPPTLRRTVELRLLHDRPSAEVCSALHISQQNLFVRLHRARRALAS